MNLGATFVFLSCFALVLGRGVKEVTDSHPLSTAVGDLITNVLRDSEIQNLRINMAVSNESTMVNTDVGNEITKIAMERFKVHTRGNLRISKAHEKRRSPIILTIDSIATFNSVKSKIEHDIPKFYIILLTGGIFKEIGEILNFFWRNSVSDVNFLEAAQSSVRMHTFFPFAREKCGTDLSLVHINTFDLSSQAWSGDQYFPSKVKNLNRCTLKVGMIVNVPLVILDNSTDDGFDGIEITLIREMAAAFNFVPRFSKPFESVGSIYANSTASGLMGAIYKRQQDIAIGTLSLQIDRTKFLSPTTSFATIPIVIVMPPTSQISPFTKLYLPFDLTTWSLIFAIFFVGYVIIILTRFFATTLYRLIVGHKVNYPFTNMFIAFFGTTQSKLPSANFSRFLLAKFLIFCLVIRGLYQGKLFDIMQKEIYEKAPTTINDLVGRNFCFYTYESLSKRVQGQSFAHRVKMIKNAELEEYRLKTLDSSFRGVVFSYEYQVVFLNSINKKNYQYLVLNERFVTNQMVFYMQENHFLVDEISARINWLRDFGILEHIISRYVDNSQLAALAPEKSARPLHFRELYGVFGLWLGGIVLSLIVLIAEISVSCKKPLRRKMKIALVLPKKRHETGA